MSKGLTHLQSSSHPSKTLGCCNSSNDIFKYSNSFELPKPSGKSGDRAIFSSSDRLFHPAELRGNKLNIFFCVCVCKSVKHDPKGKKKEIWGTLVCSTTTYSFLGTYQQISLYRSYSVPRVLAIVGDGLGENIPGILR